MTTTTHLPYSRTVNVAIPTDAAPIMLPDCPTYHPARLRIRTPRAATRPYTDSELQTAANMLDRLRGNHYCMPAEFAESILRHDAERVIDVVTDRLLDCL